MGTVYSPHRAVMVWDKLMEAGRGIRIEVGGYKVSICCALKKATVISPRISRPPTRRMRAVRASVCSSTKATSLEETR